MHVCLYFQHPLIDPGDIVHYAENMRFYTREHFLSFRSSAGGKKQKVAFPLKVYPSHVVSTITE